MVIVATLHVFVCALGLFGLCQSACFFKELVITDLKNPPKGCLDDDGKEHSFGSEWEKDCKSCTCDKNGLSCCNMIPESSEVYIGEECELLVDKKDCSVKLVLKSDKNKECTPV
ncbi:beta-microseminoprotein [Echeneis naucrates]|uniref:beta-microseminoprotein n=1 Tax=Echeneis naucrates TaxID=173247 RepID=UPI001113D1D0|nr:beta-microseminoprotein [Echeneis naucrates]